MQITKKDILWNYAATFLKIASGVLLLPLILKKMPAETVGVWAVFMTITSFVSILDFGFGPSFIRNITYVFSGVKSLKKIGFETVNKENNIIIDYGLLKGLISTMKLFYLRVASFLFFLLLTLGTYYIYMLLDEYKGNQLEVYISWFLLCLINTYNLFSLYYDALLQGKGLIKKSKQIQIVGQAIYLFVAVLFIMLGNSLIAIVSAQLVSVIIVRWLSYRSFFTKKMKINLIRAKARSRNEIFSAIYPNAIKIGLTSLGSFMVQKSSIIIGSLFISLQDLASYGISMQFIGLIAVFSGIYLATFQSKIAQLRIEKNITEIKQLYLKGKLILLFTYILAGSGLVILGSWVLKFMDSQTQILPVSMLVVLLVISFLESNHSLAGSILLSNNEVPFFKASMLAGIVTVVLLLLMFSLTDLGIWTMILAPGLAHLYNNWKWPYEVNKQLEISFFDNNKAFVNIKKSIKNGNRNRKRTII